jgi:hypothetical protein
VAIEPLVVVPLGGVTPELCSVPVVPTWPPVELEPPLAAVLPLVLLPNP